MSLKNISIYAVIFIWFVVNVLTALTTELYADEAYYWVYSQFLDWGYFDHPPGVAVLIWLGNFVFTGELGVRFFSILVLSVALFLTFKMTTYKNAHIFLLSIFSMFGLNLIGFLALPDVPLFFTTALFFLAYKNYLNRDTLKSSLLVAITIALMLYSKYHGIITVALIVLSNLRLLKKPSFYLIAAVSIILFLPHIVWQFENNFPSLQYHLVGRNKGDFTLLYAVEYIAGQAFYYGPFVALFFYIIVFKYRPQSLFEKGLKYNIYGFLIFFLIMSLRGRIEVNWTFSVLIPLFILGINRLKDAEKLQRWFYRLAYPSVVLILLVRVVLSFPPQGLNIPRLADFHGHKTWANEIKTKAEGMPVVTNQYQYSSLYWFYTSTPTPAMNVSGRQNQFTFWPIADTFQGKDVVFVDGRPKSQSIKDTVYDFGGRKKLLSVVKELPVYRNSKIEIGALKIVGRKYKYPLNISFQPMRLTSKIDSTTFVRVVYIDENDEKLEVSDYPLRQILRSKYLMLDQPLLPNRYEVQLYTENLGVWGRFE